MSVAIFFIATAKQMAIENSISSNSKGLPPKTAT